MRKRLILTAFTVLGVFLLVRTPLMAQSTGTKDKEEATREVERAERAEREAGRAESMTKVLVSPKLDKMIVGQPFDHEFNYVWTPGSSSDRNTTLTLSKSFTGEVTSKTGTFNVEEGIKKIRLSIIGNVRYGKIDIEIYLPGKKELKKLTIDNSADIQWSQSLDVKEGDNKYYGDWTYVINVQKAEGTYKFSMSTY
jgi:hypothetical protein